MKNIITVILFFIAVSVSGQKHKVDVVKFSGKVTTLLRDSYNVPTGEHWLIWNIDTNQLEIGDENEVWSAFSGGGGADWNTNLINIPTNLDLDGTNDVNLTGNQTVGGTKTFVASIVTNGGFFLDGDNNGSGLLYFPTNDLGIANGNSQLRLFSHQDKIGFRKSTQAAADGALLIDQNNTAVRTATFPDKDGTVAYLDDITGSGSTTLAGLTDVALAPLSDGEVLKFNGTQWTNEQQGATDVSFTSGGALTATNTKAAIDELEGLIGAGISADNQNRILNENKIKSHVKTANFLYAPDDIEVTSGADIGKQGIVEVANGTSIEGEMEDADMTEGQVLLVRTIGTGSEIVSYVKDGDTSTFRDLSGNTGNEWTAPELSQCSGTKEGGVITVDCGTISTRVVIVNQYPDAAGSATVNDLTNLPTFSSGSASTTLYTGTANSDTDNTSIAVEDIDGASTYDYERVVLPTAPTGYTITVTARGKAPADTFMALMLQNGTTTSLSDVEGNGAFQDLNQVTLTGDGNATYLRLYVRGNVSTTGNGTAYFDNILVTYTAP